MHVAQPWAVERLRIPHVVHAAALGIAVLACGSTSGTTAGTAGPCKVYQPCSLLTARDVSAALGVTSPDGGEAPSATPESTACDYPLYSAIAPSVALPSVGLGVLCSPDGITAADIEAHYAPFAGPFGVSPVGVSGLGQSAFYGVNVTTFTSLTLVVITDNYTFFNININYGSDASDVGVPLPSSALPAAEEMAQAVLSRL